MIRHKVSDGCNVQFLRKEEIGLGIVKIFFCTDHNVEVCRCGIEWGKHTEFYKEIKQKNENCNIPVQNGKPVSEKSS